MIQPIFMKKNCNQPIHKNRWAENSSYQNMNFKLLKTFIAKLNYFHQDWTRFIFLTIKLLIITKFVLIKDFFTQEFLRKVTLNTVFKYFHMTFSINNKRHNCAKTHKNISSSDFELLMFCKKHTTQQEEIIVT